MRTFIGIRSNNADHQAPLSVFIVILNCICKFLACWLITAAPGPAIALWFIPEALLAYHVFAPRAQGLLRMHRHFNTKRPEIWLTFDDGPDPKDTPRILALLNQYNARATFFVVGERAAREPELVQAMVAAGHEVGHHTHTHPLRSFWCAGPRRLDRELDAGASAIGQITGMAPRRFRPPAGHKNLWLNSALRKRGLRCVGWSVRGLERWHQQPEPVAKRLIRGIRPGAILLLHEGPSVPENVRVRALELTLKELSLRGYRCVIPTDAQLEAADLPSGESGRNTTHPITPPKIAPANASSTTC